jgi:hypothetical protein
MTSTNIAKVPPQSDNEVVAVVCYLCHDGGTDEADQPLRRDCACRGTDAGFVHLSCLAEFASFQSKQATSGMIKFIKPWRVCPSCHQFYQNNLAIDIVTEFVLFVQGQYPDDTKRQVESLYSKLRAIMGMLKRLQPVQKREAEDTANLLLSFIDRMKTEVSPLTRRYSHFEADVYNALGGIVLDEGTDESARRAVAHFENALEVNEAIGNAEGIATAKRNIAYAKSKYEGGNNNEELLKASQDVYKMRVARLGEEHENTINAGKIYALRLRQANREEEARDLLMKLFATSKQVLGPYHNTTKDIESKLQLIL